MWGIHSTLVYLSPSFEQGWKIHYSTVTVKVRFQTPEIHAKYRSTFDALATIIRDERFSGLYKGITSPLVRSFMLIAFSMALGFAITYSVFTPLFDRPLALY